PAVHALELAVAGERAEIAAHGHLRHAEALGQVGHVRRAAADGPEDLLAALGGEQGHRHTRSNMNEQPRARLLSASNEAVENPRTAAGPWGRSPWGRPCPSPARCGSSCRSGSGRATTWGGAPPRWTRSARRRCASSRRSSPSTTTW